MKEKQPSPLQASFWLTNQEKGYIIFLCSIVLLGVVARYFYLKNDNPEVYTPAGVEQLEPNHE